MNRKPIIISLAILAASAFTACVGGDEVNTEREWLNANNSWLEAQAKRTVEGTSTPYYTRVVPAYDQGSYVLMHWFNDTTKTAGNLKPFITSTVDVKYIGRYYTGAAFDSSYTQTDSIFNTKVNSVVAGWKIALQNMHVGDSCEVIVPFQSAYGTSGYGSIPAYTNLVFTMKLKSITGYEKP